MADIRPLERDDLPAVAALLAANLEDDAPGAAFLAATLLDHPWADPEVPSLVAAEDGRVVGFIGVQVRRLRLAGRDARAACCSHLVVAPEARRTAAGALLLRRCLAGPQDLTWSDTAIDVVARLWRTFGGHVDHTRSCDWLLVLRPGRWVGGALGALVRGRRASRELIPVGAMPVHALGPRLVRRAFPARDLEVSSEPATGEAVAGALESVSRGLALHVAYDEPALTRLLALVDATAGGLVCRLVRRADEPIGWYAYLCRPGGASRVLHLGARAGEADAVLGDLVAHARATGCAALTGRLEPQLDEPLRRRLAVLGFARLPVVHTHDADARLALGTTGAVLTQLDGEWWVT